MTDSVRYPQASMAGANASRAPRERRLLARKALVFAGLLAAPWGLEAGTIFMKNGYIIQGPVIDQDEHKVVLGWENGKIYLYRRFLDSVVLDAEEEAAIARRQEELTSTGAAPLQPVEGDVIHRVEDELPDSFNDLIRRFDLDAIDPGSLVEVSGTVPPAPGEDGSPWTDPSTDGTGVAAVSRRIDLESLALSIEPPLSWTLDEGEDSARWTGMAQPDGFLPSLVIARGATPRFVLEEALFALRKDPIEVMPDFQVMTESQTTIGGRAAHEVVGVGEPGRRGNLGAEAPAKAQDVTLTVRQILVPDPSGEFWLFTGFSSHATPKADLELVDKALASIRFLADASAEPVPEGLSPFESEPKESEPMDSEPLDSDPLESAPGAASPLESSPFETEPVETEPVETEPLEPEPLETEPDAGAAADAIPLDPVSAEDASLWETTDVESAPASDPATEDGTEDASAAADAPDDAAGEWPAAASEETSDATTSDEAANDSFDVLPARSVDADGPTEPASSLDADTDTDSATATATDTDTDTDTSTDTVTDPQPSTDPATESNPH